MTRWPPWSHLSYKNDVFEFIYLIFLIPHTLIHALLKISFSFLTPSYMLFLKHLPHFVSYLQITLTLGKSINKLTHSSHMHFLKHLPHSSHVLLANTSYSFSLTFPFFTYLLLFSHIFLPSHLSFTSHIPPVTSLTSSFFTHSILIYYL